MDQGGGVTCSLGEDHGTNRLRIGSLDVAEPRAALPGELSERASRQQRVAGLLPGRLLQPGDRGGGIAREQRRVHQRTHPHGAARLARQHLGDDGAGQLVSLPARTRWSTWSISRARRAAGSAAGVRRAACPASSAAASGAPRAPAA